MSIDIIQGDAPAVLAGLPARSVHCVITSPPYFGLRNYNAGPMEIGAEDTPAAYVAHLVEVFRAVRRVLRDDGVLWVVIGDSYANDSKWGGNGSGPTTKNWTSGRGGYAGQKVKRHTGFKSKDLMLIPHRVAIALQADGWYVRQELVWSKPAPMPESVTDRCTRSHEFVFMLAKQERYYYDQEAIREPCTGYGGTNGPAPGHKMPAETTNGRHGSTLKGARTGQGRNRRSVWAINTQALDAEHYAAFPEALVTPMILAGTSEAGCCPRCSAPWRRVVERTKVGQRRPAHAHGGRHPRRETSPGVMDCSATTGLDWQHSVQTTGWEAGCPCEAGPPLPCTTLDPFLGSGTTALVSKRLGRSCVGIELNPAYCDLAQRRVESTPYTLFSAASTSTGAAR